MVDLVRLAIFIAVLVHGIRARFGLGIVVGLVSLALLALEVSVPLRWPLANGSLFTGLGAVFLGPSMLANAAPLPGARVLAEPLHHALLAAIGAAAAHLGYAKSRSLPPLRPTAYRLDRAALSLVAVGVVQGILTVTGALLRVVERDAMG